MSNILPVLKFKIPSNYNVLELQHLLRIILSHVCFSFSFVYTAYFFSFLNFQTTSSIILIYSLLFLSLLFSCIYFLCRDGSPDKNDDDDNSDDDEEDDEECNDESEFPSLSSVGSGGSMGSGGGGGDSSPSLTHSMAMVEQVLSNGSIDRLEKIDRLEAILSAATQGSSQPSSVSPTGISSRNSSACCHCHCHSQHTPSPPVLGSPLHSMALNMNSPSGITPSLNGTAQLSDAQCQTLSTGDIVITKVFFHETNENVPPANATKERIHV